MGLIKLAWVLTMPVKHKLPFENRTQAMSTLMQDDLMRTSAKGQLGQCRSALLGVAFVAVAMLAGGGAAHAQSASAAAASGAARATVASALKITHPVGSALRFGTFSAGTGGTVSVSQTGAGSFTGDIGTVAGSSVSADSFTITGDTTRAFTFTGSSANIVSMGSPAAASMSFSLSMPAAATLASGTYTLRVGGTLNVAANQSPGAYSGSYTVTVTYQ